MAKEQSSCLIFRGASWPGLLHGVGALGASSSRPSFLQSFFSPASQHHSFNGALALPLSQLDAPTFPVRFISFHSSSYSRSTRSMP